MKNKSMDDVTDDSWSEEDIQIGRLLLAVAEMQSFIHDDYTTATARHKSLPTTKDHWTKSQLKHSSALNVRNRPLPENVDEVSIAIRRAKIASAWSLKQSCDTNLWTDVCNLYAMIVAVEKDRTKFAVLKLRKLVDQQLAKQKKKEKAFAKKMFA